MTIQPVNTISLGPEVVPANMSGGNIKTVPADKAAAPAPVAAPVKQGAAPQTDTKQVTDELNKIIEKMGVELSFSVDKELNMVVVTVSKSDSNEVIRQIPSKDMVDLAKRLKEMEARGEAKGALLSGLIG